MHAYSLVEASEASIDAEALALGVAVEGIVKEVLTDRPTPDEALKGAVAKAKGAVSRLGLDQTYQNRFCGALDHVLMPRTKERLHELASQGRIRKEHVDTWARLRNTWAHGSRPRDWGNQQLLDSISTVTVLFYCLVFAAIGYEGPFTDYSRRGWPDANYPESVSQSGVASTCDTPNG